MDGADGRPKCRQEKFEIFLVTIYLFLCVFRAFFFLYGYMDIWTDMSVSCSDLFYHRNYWFPVKSSIFGVFTETEWRNGRKEEKNTKFYYSPAKKKKQKCIDFIQRNSSLAWRSPFLEANAMCILDIYMPFLL